MFFNVLCVYIIKKSRLLESNQRPVDNHKKQLQSNALPTELKRESPRRDLNSGSFDYKSNALPLGHKGTYYYT